MKKWGTYEISGKADSLWEHDHMLFEVVFFVLCLFNDSLEQIPVASSFFHSFVVIVHRHHGFAHRWGY